MPRPSAPFLENDFTGRTRLRRTLLGRLVLQLEEEAGDGDAALPAPANNWRDVRQSDLSRLRDTRAYFQMDALL